MAVIPMQKIQVLGVRDKLEKAMTLLQKKNVMEIHDLAEDVAAKVKPAQKHNHDLELKLANL